LFAGSTRIAAHSDMPFAILRYFTRATSFSPPPDVLFLVRAGGLAPFIYRSSTLLDELHQRIQIPTILCYPGSAQAGTDLRFYDLPVEGSLGVYNYRVKVYGTIR
jgi:Domain of unknown function (DUF1788)